MSDLTLEHWPTERVIDYASNPRKNDHAVDRMAAAIAEFGFRMPCVVQSDGRLVDGHLRLKAARKLGLETVPVVLADELTPAQIKAFRILANRSATWADWDFDLLRLELQDLDTGELDLSLTGFSAEELEQMLTWAPPNDGLTDPDEVPELEEEAITKPGDVWLLGRHRLMCGDSTDAECVETLLAGVKPHLMVTDPPYGVEYDANWRNEADRANGKPYGASAIGKVENDNRADWSEAWALFPGDVAYVWHADVHSHTVALSLEKNDYDMRALIVWAKSNFAIGRGHYHHGHEPCWYAVRKGSAGHWSGDRKQSTLWQIDKPRKSETGHSTQKPVECMRRPMENNSSPGQAVYEPFSGSGTSIIAAEQTGRVCYAMELSPLYVDVAVKRWQAFTGKKATLESSGVEFGG